MPAKKREIHMLLQISTGKEIDPEVWNAVIRFNQFARNYKNKGKALQSLLDKAKIA